VISCGVADDGAIVGIERAQLESDDKFMRHLAQVVRNGLGDRAGTCIDPKTQITSERGSEDPSAGSHSMPGRRGLSSWLVTGGVEDRERRPSQVRALSLRRSQASRR
jgi:hypothetical protein